MTWRAVMDSTGGAFALVDHLVQRGNASPVHVHERDDETFFVLDGELRVFVGEEEHTAGPGTVAVLPRRLRHAYVVTSATARFLTLHTPAGFGQFAAEVGEPARALTLPPPPAGPPDFAALASSSRRRRVTSATRVPARHGQRDPDRAAVAGLRAARILRAFLSSATSRCAQPGCTCRRPPAAGDQSG
jgi:quercetin dioxygenase-like cupin family protein